ncbi:glycosyltransferase family 4 protein [Anaerococcus tetradius]|uniref:glycosyltransferase family 4 protein n=1 Tax=Anaerococcus tetradius TaxID=33036 RepID=UPI0023F13DA1|nr:glycosyltransferase family 4 protein [Anaerococcus tetradius]
MSNLNLLFLSLDRYNEHNITENGIYTSLLREFTKSDYNVYIISPIERRDYIGEIEKLKFINEIHYLDVKIGNITKTNKIEKGIATINIENQFLRAIKVWLSDVKFDIVIYPTPPITFYKVIKYLKRRDGALTYLMLKDIFPQNAVDLGFFSKKSLIYKYFRKKEKKLYEISDYIGCMSKANVDYLLKCNPNLDKKKVEIFPNSIEPVNLSIDEEEKYFVREKYNLPHDKRIFIYGGNLGKPQGLTFLLNCIESIKSIDDIMFLMVGNGTEFEYIVKMKDELNLYNLRIMAKLSKDDFDKLVASSDVGIISLDHRFTIPNYPSRILSYMQSKLPILAITDNNSDIGLDIIENNMGWRCKENSINEFRDTISEIMTNFNIHKISDKKENSFEYLKNNFDVRKSIINIINKI